MSEYKFRAWYSSGTKELMLYEDYPGQVFKWLSEGQPLEIMQYTGLKDKRGVEIYKADLYREGDNLYKVVRMDEHAMYGLKVIKTNYVLIRGLTFPIWHYIGNAPLQTRGEIVGNIYENSALLNN
ncbi:YopX family protein [Shouchella clausii]|jgi:uncharacterized phage protein (TIGR01671 family)|uniref:YopX protein domain-containing protein n=1 Tax=Shouchella clausii TaxID=79880 RepID=A0A268NXF0_SHOCL|nr:YopX family protein [Shouchella clausii]PAE87740.1 hypothetical protein CHH72_16555 [Shouchella clausii]